MPWMQRKSRPSSSHGEAWFRFGRWLISRRWYYKNKSTRSTKTINSEMYSVSCACVPMSGCKLSSSFVSEDETCGATYEELQTENARWLSDLQATYRSLLLSRETLPRSKMFGALLSEYQAKTETAATATKVSLY